MALNNQRFSASELDFDGIKTSLKNYLKGQSQFSGYDFDGSSMSILLDVLAYNTHYRALYDNFILNEMFLDSASKRSSVVSRAAELGYTPSSSKAAKAVINFEVSNLINGPSILQLPKGTAFTTTMNNVQYEFITLESHSTAAVSGKYTFNNITIQQGQYVTDRFNVTDSSIYSIVNSNIDTSTLTVKVQENSTSSIYTPFNLAEGLVGLKSTDNVYWLKEVDSGKYVLEFGNGIIGKKLVNGNVVHIEYLTTSGLSGNNAKIFGYSAATVYGAYPKITVVASSYGGSNGESIDAIKFNAPRLYSTQNRAVTVDDYRNLTYALVPEAESVNVWSGGDNSPPQYGKVFICIKPKTLETFTSLQKLAIKNDIIGTKNVTTIIPEIVDPQYLKVGINTTIYYNEKATTKSPNDLKLIIQNAILQYNAENLLKFDGILRYSKLMRKIDDSDASIISNITAMTLYRKVNPKFDMVGSYTINVGNPIYAEMGGSEISVSSSGFYILGSTDIHYVEDVGLGVMYLYKYVNNVKSIINPRIGTVNYGIGAIQLNGLYVTNIVGNEWVFKIKPSSYDIVSVRDQLVIIPPEYITVTALADLSLSTSGGGANYVFTTSRS